MYEVKMVKKCITMVAYLVLSSSALSQSIESDNAGGPTLRFFGSSVSMGLPDSQHAISKEDALEKVRNVFTVEDDSTTTVTNKFTLDDIATVMSGGSIEPMGTSVRFSSNATPYARVRSLINISERHTGKVTFSYTIYPNENAVEAYSTKYTPRYSFEATFSCASSYNYSQTYGSPLEYDGISLRGERTEISSAEVATKEFSTLNENGEFIKANAFSFSDTVEVQGCGAFMLQIIAQHHYSDMQYKNVPFMVYLDIDDFILH